MLSWQLGSGLDYTWVCHLFFWDTEIQHLWPEASSPLQVPVHGIAQVCPVTGSCELLRSVTVSLCRLLLKLGRHQRAELPGYKPIQNCSEISVIKSSQQLFCLGTVKISPRAKGYEHRRQSPGRWGHSSGELVQVARSPALQPVPLSTRWLFITNVYSQIYGLEIRVPEKKAFLYKTRHCIFLIWLLDPKEDQFNKSVWRLLGFQND